MARIVIIEDNANNLALMGYLLNAAGHVVAGCRDGQSGVDEVLRAPPDLVVCDIQLPKLTGHAVAKAIRAAPERRTVPLVAVSALAMPGDREQALASGFDGYIAKPIQPETFVAEVEAFLPEAARRGLRSPAPAPAAPVAAAPRARTVLVVDDIATNLRLMRAIFEGAGYRVLEADHMQAALGLMRVEKVDLVVSDVHMPGGNGFTFRRAALGEPDIARVPFIFVSSSVIESADRREAGELGVCRLVERPIEPHSLLALVDSCLTATARPA